MASRKYESQLRVQQAEDTRKRILEGAARLTLLNVGRVTHAAVARSAGVSERTVYRHFATVADLHDAFTTYQEQRFGRDEFRDFTIDELVPMYEGWLERIAGTEALDYVVREQKDPPFLVKSRRKRYARLERAIGELVPGATAMERRQLVLVFGALASPEVFRRAKVILRMNPEHVVPGPAWAMRVLIEALRKGDTPWNRS
jgi:AcrR family transcriptional regulator